MFSDLAISVSELSKCYHIYDHPRDRLLQMLFRGRRQFFQEFWALRDVSFEVARGEVIGVVGRNGSGKSTLLQLICGTLSPTSGNISVRGRVAALLELGSGFNPEFTGLENVFLNGSILGLKREEIQERLDEILGFADIGDFVHQPVKTYSSGMYLRLAFAVSVCVDPDVLIVDETLSVGDVFFQTKCFRRFEKLMNAGTTVLFVSHSTDQIVRQCSRALLLERGHMVATGSPQVIANQYLDSLFGASAKPTSVAKQKEQEDTLGGRSFEERPGYNKHEYRWGNGTARIRDFLLYRNSQLEHHTVFDAGDTLNLSMRVEFLERCSAPIFGLTVKTPDGVTVYGNNSRDVKGGPVCQPIEAGESVAVTFKLVLSLGRGDYFLSVGVAEDDGTQIVPKDRRYDAVHIEVRNSINSFGLVELGMECSVVQTEVAVPNCVRS